MPKFFVVSDIHSFFSQFKTAIDNAGFEPGNKEHLLIIVGDIFDRGDESCELFKYLNKVPNKVLVLGNHEELLENCVDRGYPLMHDHHNGTSTTIYDLGGGKYGRDFADCCHITWNLVKPLLDQMVDYYETEKYIFVHSQIPLKEDWRNSHTQEWKDARWGNPFEFWEQVGIEGKTVVFGHWHTSWYNSPLHEFDNQADFSIAYGDGFIGLDACTAYSGKVNVLVIEDELLEKM